MQLFPIFTISFASASASSLVCINAPLPHFTSSAMFCAPAASFLLIMLDAISAMLSTVAVASRRAYKSLSAGARSPVCPIMLTPTRLTWAKNSSLESAVRYPGMLSNLSTVPPVCPSPRPLIFAIFKPHEAQIGATISVVLSPTPPVECLSAVMPSMAERSSISPECAIQSVKATASSSSIPFRQIAIKSADA